MLYVEKQKTFLSRGDVQMILSSINENNKQKSFKLKEE